MADMVIQAEHAHTNKKKNKNKLTDLRVRCVRRTRRKTQGIGSARNMRLFCFWCLGIILSEWRVTWLVLFSCSEGCESGGGILGVRCLLCACDVEEGAEVLSFDAMDLVKTSKPEGGRWVWGG